MKKLFVLLTFVSVFVLAQTPPDPPVAPIGGLCDLGANAAATLLVPYWEVDSQNDYGLDTLIGIVNVDDDPIIAHVVIWNVDSWEIGDFNIYLTGYDVVTFRMRDIVNGKFPNNGCPNPDAGGYKFTTRYIDCNADGTYFGQLNSSISEMLGGGMDYACYPPNPSWGDRLKCFTSEAPYVAFSTNYIGYMTIDAMITCNGGFPTYASYYAPNYIDTDPAVNPGPDHGMLENSNVLIADIIYYDNANMQSDGMPAAHIEAFGEQNLLAGHTWGMLPGDFATLGINDFYGKFEIGWFGMPQYSCREQLPVEWAFRYIKNAAFNGGTWVDIWRSHNPFFDHWYVPNGPCNMPGLGNIYTVIYNPFTGDLGLPNPVLFIFDEDERTVSTEGCPSPCEVGALPIPEETQRMNVSLPDWPLPAEAGWIKINLLTDSAFFGPGWGNSYDQAWINVRYSALNKYTVGLSGVATLNGCALVWDSVSGAFVPTPTH